MPRGRPRKVRTFKEWLKRPSGEWTLELFDGHVVKINCTDMEFDVMDGFVDYNREFHLMKGKRHLDGLPALISVLTLYCFRELYSEDEVIRIVDLLDAKVREATEEIAEEPAEPEPEEEEGYEDEDEEEELDEEDGE